MPRRRSHRPVCGGCGAASVFSWTGGAHHCVVAEPEQALDDTPLLLRPLTDPPPAAPAPQFGSATGLADYIAHANRGRIPIHRNVIAFDGVHAGHRIQVAMQWHTGAATAVTTFIDTTPADDGSHEDEFVGSVAAVVSGFARRQRRITGDGPDLTAADVGPGLTAVVSVHTAAPGTVPAGAAVAGVCGERLTHWLNADPATAQTIVNKAVTTRIARDRPRAG